jgi:hypothetical protein
MSDTIKTRVALKEFFQTGDVPTQSDFDDLITTMAVRDTVTGKVPASELDVEDTINSAIDAHAATMPAPDQIVVRQQDGSPFKVGTDGTPYLYNPTTQMYHRLTLQGLEGQVVVTADQTGVSVIP